VAQLKGGKGGERWAPDVLGKGVWADALAPNTASENSGNQDGGSEEKKEGWGKTSKKPKQGGRGRGMCPTQKRGNAKQPPSPKRVTQAKERETPERRTNVQKWGSRMVQKDKKSNFTPAGKSSGNLNRKLQGKGAGCKGTQKRANIVVHASPSLEGFKAKE